jgi:malate dehydrogenase (oxaloacetate-decarboxylating)
MKDYDAASLALHEKYRGKLEVKGVVEISDKDMLATVYTPGVAAPCLAIAKDPALARVLTIKGRTVAVVTDGTAVLGLGDIGPLASLPVMEGKAMLFKAFAGIDAFPIALDTKDVDEIVATVRRIAPAFGGINLEDISAPRCFEIERRLTDELDIPVFHDDQHGTAIVVLAGLINACRVTRRDVSSAKIVFSGAGAAGVAVAKLLHAYGAEDITLCDSKGVIGPDRQDLDDSKRGLLAWSNPRKLTGPLAEAMSGADVFIGLSKGGIVSREMVASMAPGPIVFAMANPTPEIMPDEAQAAGAAVVATGRSDFPNQINNLLAFPGVFRGVLDAGVSKITEKMKLAAAAALSALVRGPSAVRIVPDALEPGVAAAVAAAVSRSALG